MEQCNSILRGEPESVHVVFLHNKFKTRPSDRYILDMASAIKQQGNLVSIYTSEIEEDTKCLQKATNSINDINISFCGWWLPPNWKFLRSAMMAFKLVLFPPMPMPTIVVLDVNSIALYILSMLSNFKLIYVSSFAKLQQTDTICENVTITPDVFSTIALKYADEIIVPSEGLAEVFRRSYPLLRKELKILHPCVDKELQNDPSVAISKILNAGKPLFLFVCFGSYKKRSNFKLVLHAFEDLLLISPSNIKNNIHLVIAGHYDEFLPEQQLSYYNDLLDCIKERNSASQITFLKYIPTACRNALIEECIGVLFPCKHELFPDTILEVLAKSKPIIATNSGFAKEALRHRISALLVDPTPPLFAAAMYKIMTNPTVQEFIGDMGHDLFLKYYCNAAFTRKINSIIRNNACLHVPFMRKLQNIK